MSKYVLDSFAVLAFLQQEKGWERVRQLIQEAVEGKTQLYISSINLAEVQYMVLRRERNSSQILAAIEALPFNVESADECIQQVVDLKAGYPVSLADCFAAALAVKLDCPLVTADPEFKKLEKIVNIEWL